LWVGWLVGGCCWWAGFLVNSKNIGDWVVLLGIYKKYIE